MVADARPGYPMLFFFDLQVAGPLSLDRLRAATEAAAARHPNVRSRVAWRGGRPFWLPPDVRPVVETCTAAPWRPIDLTRESGLRLVVMPLATQLDHTASADAPLDRHRLVLVAHHAALDGVAAAEFLGDVWACYDGREPPPFKSGRVTDARSDRPVAAAAPPPPASGAWTFAVFRPSPLVRRTFSAAATSPTFEHQPTGCPAPLFETRAFGREQAGRLRSAAATHGCSVNDLVVAATMRAAGGWNARAGGRAGNVRITMPVSLRPAGSRGPARNEIGYAFLDRRPAECVDRHGLATGVATASRWIVENAAAAEFVRTTGSLAARPWLLRLATRMPVCFSTAVVSTIGDASRRMRAGVPRIDGLDAPGGLAIESFHAVPPLRPGTRAAIGVVSYSGDLSLTCLCSADATGHGSRAAAREFVDVVAEETLAFL